MITVKNDHKVYRITPHRGTLNSQNRRLWAVMHELLSLYTSLPSRTTRERMKVRIREKDDIWWIVRMTYEEDPEIQFFVGVTETFDDVFRLRLSNHEQWKHNTLMEASKEDFQIPLEDTACSEIRLLRENMFSLTCTHTEQTSPLRNILDVVHQLKKGDSLAMFIRLEALPRIKWKKLSEYSWKIWADGKVPQRNQIKPERAMQAGKKFVTSAINEVLGVTEDLVKAVEGSFFTVKESGVKIDKIEMKDMERQQLLVNGDLSRETKNKQNHPAFKTTIRVLAHCEETTRRDMLLQSVGGAFIELAGDNRMVMERGRKKAIKECLDLDYDTLDRDFMVLSNEEIAKMVQLPTAEIQREFMDLMKSNQSVEVDVPNVFKDPAGIYMGSVTKKDVVTDLYIPTNREDMLYQPRAFVASPRMGKDMAIVNFIVEAKRNHGIGAVILDTIDERGQRGMSDAIRDALEPEDIIDLNLGDYDWPIYLGLENITHTTNDRMAQNRIAQELTNFLMGEGGADRTEDYLFACAQAASADPVAIKAILTNPDVRQEYIDNATDEDVRETLEQFNNMKGMQGQISQPVITRINKILRDAFLRPIFGQRANPKVAWNTWLEENKVIIVRVPTRDLGTMAVKTIMHWLTMVVFLAKVGGTKGETFIVFNEPHQYETQGWVEFVERILLEGPKYRINAIFAFHLFEKLSKSLVNTLMSGGVNWHIGNNSSLKVFEQLEDVLSPVFTPELAKAQVKAYHFIAAWRDNQGEYQTPFVYKAPDLVHNRYETKDNSWLTEQYSKNYGRPAEEVLTDIRKRSRATPVETAQ